MDGEIRVGNQITITVNDNNDTIVLNLDDSSFLDRFMDLEESFQAASDYFEEKMDGLTLREQVKVSNEKMKEISSEIDTVFGEGTCKKVFGDFVPTPYIVAEFFEQLLPLIEKNAAERQKQIALKYNANRKGSGKQQKAEKLIKEHKEIKK